MAHTRADAPAAQLRHTRTARPTGLGQRRAVPPMQVTVLCQGAAFRYPLRHTATAVTATKAQRTRVLVERAATLTRQVIATPTQAELQARIQVLVLAALLRRTMQISAGRRQLRRTPVLVQAVL